MRQTALIARGNADQYDVTESDFTTRLAAMGGDDCAEPAEVRSWNTAAADAATALPPRLPFGDELASASRGIDDLRHDWSGIAYDAARDRIDAERAAGQSLSNEVRDLAKTSTTARSGVWPGRAPWHGLKPRSPTGHRARRLERGRCAGAPGKLLVAHRDAVVEAAAALAREDTEVARLIEDAAQRIRAR